MDGQTDVKNPEIKINKIQFQILASVIFNRWDLLKKFFNPLFQKPLVRGGLNFYQIRLADQRARTGRENFCWQLAHKQIIYKFLNLLGGNLSIESSIPPRVRNFYLYFFRLIIKINFNNYF